VVVAQLDVVGGSLASRSMVRILPDSGELPQARLGVDGVGAEIPACQPRSIGRPSDRPFAHSLSNSARGTEHDPFFLRFSYIYDH
jgi:hypothetical protein